MAHYHLYSQGVSGRVNILATRVNRHTLRDHWETRKKYLPAAMHFIRRCTIPDADCSLMVTESGRQSPTPMPAQKSGGHNIIKLVPAGRDDFIVSQFRDGGG